MIDLRPPLNEALGNISSWRNKYTRKEYPHKIVLNIMYRAYTTKLVFEAFSKDELPDFDDYNEASTEIHKFYGQMAITEVHANLIRWMTTNSNEAVGTVCTARLENLASKAESDSQALEELEFTYIFELLNDMSVLFWIAFRLCGESEVNAICKLCDAMIRPLDHMDYAITKQVFQQLLVAPYMNKNYRPLPQY